MNQSLILRAGNLRLDLRPDLGGSIAGLHWNERPVLRQSPEALDEVLEAACFPLVPFCNRIRGGIFTFRGR